MPMIGIGDALSFYGKEFNTENSGDTEDTEKKKARV
jgi:hypothetical protein